MQLYHSNGFKICGNSKSYSSYFSKYPDSRSKKEISINKKKIKEREERHFKRRKSELKSYTEEKLDFLLENKQQCTCRGLNPKCFKCSGSGFIENNETNPLIIPPNKHIIKKIKQKDTSPSLKSKKSTTKQKDTPSSLKSKKSTTKQNNILLRKYSICQYCGYKAKDDLFLKKHQNLCIERKKIIRELLQKNDVKIKKIVNNYNDNTLDKKVQINHTKPKNQTNERFFKHYGIKLYTKEEMKSLMVETKKKNKIFFDEDDSKLLFQFIYKNDYNSIIDTFKDKKESNNPFILFYLGKTYLEIYQKENMLHNEGLKLIIKASALEYQSAQLYLGKLYIAGQKVEKNFVKGINLILNSYKQGNIESKNILIKMLTTIH